MSSESNAARRFEMASRFFPRLLQVVVSVGCFTVRRRMRLGAGIVQGSNASSTISTGTDEFSTDELVRQDNELLAKAGAGSGAGASTVPSAPPLPPGTSPEVPMATAVQQDAMHANTDVPQALPMSLQVHHVQKAEL